MQLITPEVRSALLNYPLGSQERLGDRARVVIKFFFPAGRYTFYVTEAEAQDDDYLFFGYCVSPLGPDCDEWGYTALSELQSVNVRGLTIERDICLPIGERTVRDLLGRAA